MNKALFFIDIEGTFTTNAEKITPEERKELIESLFTHLQKIAEAKELNELSFSFISSDKKEEVQSYIDEVNPYITSGKFPNIVWGTCFAEEDKTYPAEDYGEFIPFGDLLTKPLAILKETSIEQQRAKIKELSLRKDDITRSDMDSATKIELMLKISEEKAKAAELIDSLQNNPMSQPHFERDNPVSEVYFVDDSRFNLSILNNCAKHFENAPTITCFQPGLETSTESTYGSSRKGLQGTVSMITAHSQRLNPAF